MSVPGREPNPDALNRNAPQVPWTEVPDVLYKGKKPALPKTRTIEGADGPEEQPLHPSTTKWWATVSTMPHVINWAPSDWQFAVDTALIADMLHYGKHSVGTELRNRGNDLGMTAEARRKLRIRYIPVTPKPRVSKTTAKTGNVTQIDPRRLRGNTPA